MKNDNFKWHAFSLTIIPLAIGVIVGLFIKSTVDDKYITLLIGLLAAIFAFMGVIYSKHKEREIKELELEDKKREEKEKLLGQKKEEIITMLYTTKMSIVHITDNFSLKIINNEQEKLTYESSLRMSLMKYETASSKVSALCSIYKIGEQEIINNFFQSCNQLLEPICQDIFDRNHVIPYVVSLPQKQHLKNFDDSFSIATKSIIN